MQRAEIGSQIVESQALVSSSCEDPAVGLSQIDKMGTGEWKEKFAQGPTFASESRHPHKRWANWISPPPHTHTHTPLPIWVGISLVWFVAQQADTPTIPGLFWEIKHLSARLAQRAMSFFLSLSLFLSFSSVYMWGWWEGLPSTPPHRARITPEELLCTRRRGKKLSTRFYVLQPPVWAHYDSPPSAVRFITDSLKQFVPLWRFKETRLGVCFPQTSHRGRDGALKIVLSCVARPPRDGSVWVLLITYDSMWNVLNCNISPDSGLSVTALSVLYTYCLFCLFHSFFLNTTGQRLCIVHICVLIT